MAENVKYRYTEITLKRGLIYNKYMYVYIAYMDDYYHESLGTNSFAGTPFARAASARNLVNVVVKTLFESAKMRVQ